MIDDALIRNIAVTFAVCCVWLPVGIVNRQERWVIRSTLAAAAVALVDLGAFGLFIDKYVVHLGLP